MKPTDRKTIAEFVGVAAIVASLIFVGLQMKQAEEIANAARRSSVVANTIELSNAINEYADLWLRGMAGEPLNDVESVIFENLVLAKTQFHQHEFSAARILGSEVGMAAHIADFAEFLHANPGASRVWNARQEMYEEVFPLIYSATNNVPLSFGGGVRSTLEKFEQAREKQ